MMHDETVYRLSTASFMLLLYVVLLVSSSFIPVHISQIRKLPPASVYEYLILIS